MLSRKNLILLLILIFTGVSFYYFGSQNTTSQDSEKTLELTTVKISKGDLSKKEEYSGTLSQVDKSILNSSITGVVTYLPEEGAIINFGQVLYAVDNKPVILLQGSIPFYRTLDLNSDDGPDIKQIEEALVDLGYSDDGFTPDENFDETTSEMLNNSLQLISIFDIFLRLLIPLGIDVIGDLIIKVSRFLRLNIVLNTLSDALLTPFKLMLNDFNFLNLGNNCRNWPSDSISSV